MEKVIDMVPEIILRILRKSVLIRQEEAMHCTTEFIEHTT